MPTSWVSWRRSLACKSQPGDVHDPRSLAQSSAKVEAVLVSRRLYRSGCSRSIANLRDVIHSSRRIDASRAAAAIPNFSPKSVESNDFIQSISHEAMLRDHECDHHHHHHHHNHYQRRQHSHGKLSLDDIVADHHPHPYHHHHNYNGTVLKSSNNANVGSFYGTPLHHSARAATPLHHSASKGMSLKKFSGCYDCKNSAVSLVVYTTSSGGGGGGGSSSSNLPPVARPVCQRCGEAFTKYESLEQHHLLKHAVTELEVGDSSRNVVEIIFRTSWLRGPAAAAASVAPPAGGGMRIERVLKVNNLARTLARFEDYREGVKTRASKLPKKHPRCLADGNELLRFYGATLECGLLTAPRDAAVQAREGVAAACNSASCAVCKIIRTGFPKMRGPDGGKKGILTTATSGRAHQILSADDQLREKENDRDSDHDGARSSDGGLVAMLVCRVIAGRVHKPPSTPPNSGDLGPPSAGFDSVAGGDAGVGAAPTAAGLHSRFEELTVFSPRAILPCFVVLYRC